MMVETHRSFFYIWLLPVNLHVSVQELESGRTHDELWNSAQLQLVKDGKIHGFMRMYWAKKILEWTESPEYVENHLLFSAELKPPHRAMFKLGAKIVFLLCHLVMKMSAVFSADRCKFWEAEKAVSDQNWIGGDISSDRVHNSEHFGHFRFPISVSNWHFFIKVCTYVIGLSCLLRRIL